MTSHYVDIAVRPDPEMTSATILNSLFAKLHRQLVASQRTDIGVSFPAEPEDRKGLGTIMRIHSNQAGLETLMNSPWIGGLSGYLQQGTVQLVPADCSYRLIRRKQAKSSPERLKRRFQKRHGMEASENYDQLTAKQLKLPYLRLVSGSTGQHFRLFIDQCVESSEPIEGSFNSYGLSNSATTPWF